MEYRKRWGFAPNPAVAAEIARLDPKADCQRIVHLLTAYEFGFDITRALEVALFYTYGSQRVSALLDKTGEFREYGQKRYDDTRLLIAYFMDSGWDGPVGQAALARMNASHAHYRIPQDDFLFVLWTFVHFPIDWCAHHAWRPMTALEQEAWFHFWIGIGSRMGLTELPATRAEFDARVAAYKQTYFVPSAASARVAEATLNILRGWFPRFLSPVIAPVVYSLLDEPLFLQAVQAKPAPRWLIPVIKASLRVMATLRKLWVPEAYPMTPDGRRNRTYPDHQFGIQDLVPKKLRAAEDKT